MHCLLTQYIRGHTSTSFLQLLSRYDHRYMLFVEIFAIFVVIFLQLVLQKSTAIKIHGCIVRKPRRPTNLSSGNNETIIIKVNKKTINVSIVF